MMQSPWRSGLYPNRAGHMSRERYASGSMSMAGVGAYGTLTSSIDGTTKCKSAQWFDINVLLFPGCGSERWNGSSRRGPDFVPRDGRRLLR
jgi:hypothetical protein